MSRQQSQEAPGIGETHGARYETANQSENFQISGRIRTKEIALITKRKRNRSLSVSVRINLKKDNGVAFPDLIVEIL